MKQYGDEWKCMTSPKDHKAIQRANERGHAEQQKVSKRGKGFRGTPAWKKKKKT